jgi:hypothetical protein
MSISEHGRRPPRPQKFERAGTRNVRRPAGDSAQPTWRKMLMNRLIVAALILSPLVARAWEPLQGALSLDFGACWIRQETPEPPLEDRLIRRSRGEQLWGE